MDKPFVYGMSVEGENFTDRIRETARLKKDLENGMNVILMSPRRMGKTSLVKKVRSEISDPKVKVVLMDIYDCRNAFKHNYYIYETKKIMCSLRRAVGLPDGLGTGKPQSEGGRGHA